MSDESFGERTEPATPRKREKARQSGQVAKSQDMNTAILLLGALLILNFYGGKILEQMSLLNIRLLSNLHLRELTPTNLRFYAGQGLFLIMQMLLPLLAGLFILAIAVNILQVGPGISPDVFIPKTSRFNPINGFKRMFSMRGAVKLVMSLVKVAVIAAVLYWTVKDKVREIIPTMQLDIGAILAYVGQSCFALGVRISVVLLILAILDYVYQRWQYESDIKMTKQEVKDEMKRYEGDPKIKERRLKTQRAIAYQRMMHNVPKANVVITNPTELAIALQYEREAMAAPRVVAKGAGYVARKIREIAVAHGIPIVEKKPLAQALYKTVEIGQQIPPDLYQAIAEVLAYVYELDKSRAAWAT
jgi:flagellar biosynthetic protein FlhB